MSIRPVDLQLMVPRSTEVNRTSQIDAKRPEIAQQQFVEVMNKQAERTHQDVIETNKTEHEDIDENGSNNDRQERRKKRGKGEKTKTEEQGKHRSTSMFDITV